MFRCIVFVLVCCFLFGQVEAKKKCKSNPDLNCDGVVDYLDLEIFTEYWLEEGIVGSYIQLSDSANITFANSSVFDIEGSHSISAWVWPTDLDAFGFTFFRLSIFPVKSIIFGWGSAVGALGGDGKVIFSIRNDNLPGNPNVILEGDTSLSADKWNHIVAVKDDLDVKIRVYLNGVLDGEADGFVGVVNPGTGSSFGVGGLPAAFAMEFESKDNVRIYKNHILTQSEITALYNNGNPLPATDADFASIDGFYLNFDEGSGVTLTGRSIVSGVGSNLSSSIFSGGIDWRDESELPVGENTYLHGTSDAAVTWNDDAQIDPAGTDFTTSMWLNFDNATAQSVLDKHDGTDGYKIEMTSIGTIKATVKALELESVSSLSPSFWHHIVIAQDADGVTSLYVDNIVISASTGGNTSNNSPENFVLFPNTIAGGDEGFGVDNLKVFIGTFQNATWVSDEYNSGQGRELDLFYFNTDEDGNVINSNINGFHTDFPYASGKSFVFAMTRGWGSKISDSVSSPSTLEWVEGGYPFFIDPNDISFLATSLEPNLVQANFSQSIGGYPSISVFSPDTVIVQHLSLSDTIIEIKQPTPSGFDSFNGITYLGINDEVIEVEKVDGLIVTVVKRGVNGIIQSHPSGSFVKGLKTQNIFNNVFNNIYKQYRCIALKNISTFMAYDFGVYLPQSALNPNSFVKIAIEVPKNQEYIGTSNSWDSMKVVDTSLINSVEDFTNANININNGPNSGQNRIISSFDNSAGVLVLTESLPVDFDISVHSDNVSFTIDPGPAQRIESGTVSPVFNTERVSALSISTRKLPLSIDIHDKGGDKKNFKPNDVIYVWLERSLKKASTSFVNNSVVIKTTYSLVSV